MKSATISDVARRAGVSKSTVSAVLNDKAVVRESTRRLVLRVMEELNYRPSPVARRGFRTRPERSLAVIIKEQQNPACSEAIAGIQAVAAEHDYLVSVFCSLGRLELEQQLVRHCLEHEAAGLILMPVLSGETDLSHLYELKRHFVPFVFLESLRGIGANLVEVDHVRSMAKVVGHLIAEGHVRLLHLAGPEHSQHTQDRIEGMRRAFSGSHLVFEEEVMIVRAGSTLEAGYRAGREVFEATPRAAWPTAVVCYNDLVAIGLLRALRELGIAVPAEVSVVGFEDLALAEYLDVPLSTVRIPKHELGRRAAELVIRQIESAGEPPSERIYLEASLVLRATTRSLRALPLTAAG